MQLTDRQSAMGAQVYATCGNNTQVDTVCIKSDDIHAVMLLSAKFKIDVRLF